MERVVILGAGFGGLELATALSETLGDEVDVALIDKNDSFFFGFSKLDVMFGRRAANAVRIPYQSIMKPGVRFCQETITGIDPAARRPDRCWCLRRRCAGARIGSGLRRFCHARAG